MPPPTSTQTDEAEPLLTISEYGPDVLPGAVTSLFNRHAKGGVDLPAYKLLKGYADQHHENPYIAVVGIWNATKKHYDYKVLPLAFPDSLQQSGQGAWAYYRYRAESKGQKVYRNLAAFIPASPQAKALMN